MHILIKHCHKLIFSDMRGNLGNCDIRKQSLFQTRKKAAKIYLAQQIKRMLDCWFRNCKIHCHCGVSFTITTITRRTRT